MILYSNNQICSFDSSKRRIQKWLLCPFSLDSLCVYRKKTKKLLH